MRRLANEDILPTAEHTVDAHGQIRGGKFTRCWAVQRAERQGAEKWHVPENGLKMPARALIGTRGGWFIIGIGGGL